jgi:hypothetical protein
MSQAESTNVTTVEPVLTIAIAAEPMTRWWREAAERGLFEDHWREVGRDRDKIVLKPDFERWLHLERVNALRCFTVRKNGVLVAYAGFLFSPHLHYMDHIFAYCDVIYVAAEHRGITSVKFLKFIERELVANGASKISYHIKRDHDHSKLFEGLGYAAAETIYEKLVV